MHSVTFSLLIAPLLLLSSITQAQLVIRVQTTASNYQAAIDKAYKQLNEQIIRRVANSRSFEPQSADNFQQLSLPRIIKPQYRGRSVDKQVVKVRLDLTQTDYLYMLQLLNENLRQEITNFVDSRGGAYTHLKQLLFSVRTLLSLETEINQQQLVHLREEFFAMKNDFYEKTYLARLKFHGEIEDATILINGKERTSTTVLVAPGQHVFEIFKEGYFNVNGNVFLSPGEQRGMLIRMIRIPQKIIPIEIVLDEALKPFATDVRQTLAQLGFVDNASTSLLRIRFKWVRSTQPIVKPIGVNKTKYYNLLRIQFERKTNNEILLAKDWHQEQTVVNNNVDLEVFVADMIHRSLYNLYPQINRRKILSYYKG